ncbi:hypothetical protein, partial [Rossellomorea aquimaris]
RNSHYTGFGEVLYFLVILPLEPQGLRVMKLIQLYKDKQYKLECGRSGRENQRGISLIMIETDIQNRKHGGRK